MEQHRPQDFQMNEMDAMKEYATATVVSTAANFIMERDEAFTHTYRTYVRLREQGEIQLRFWFSNAVDSTWDKGAVARGGQFGGNWLIEAAFAADGGTGRDGGVPAQSQVPVTFGGSLTRLVRPGETFWSDPVEMDLPPNHDLAFTWTIASGSGRSVPYNTEQMLVTAYDAQGKHADEVEGDSFVPSENLLVMPAWIGYKKQGTRRMVFFGDSITQGVRTAKDGYEYWVARIADGLGAGYDIWNIGSGWARAYDASGNGAWLNKAKQGDQILIALGVNDIDIGERSAEELLGDLSTIVSLLKENNSAVDIILFTVSPFNFTGEREHIWRRVNEALRTSPPAGVSRVFDIAAVLSQPAPEEHRLRPEYMSSEFDPHPNGLAGAAVSEAFLKWYME
ncbi:lysophospholipase L1-like esterase [Fontibacillus phaseoli]|uniref:Lysophospholipase L1-like esterase n=1 Tax=Fontibacillus phaseoli TaxID=1416533 RepID=A0A369BGP9_9BACL|nr:SGNH/GDSL hydrolase family protein [Fontibacillus phaseoli]RCX20591.1 lysophospholipase L1-like esterase [Fontibacillus phaseoli]